MRPIVTLAALATSLLAAATATAETSPDDLRGPLVTGGVVVPIGEMPRVTAGFSVSGGYRWPMFSLSFEGRAHLPQPTDPDPYGISLLTELYLVSILPCFHRSWFLACGVITGGVLHVGPAGNEPVFGETTNFPRIEAGARVGVAVPLADRLALQISSDFLAEVLATNLILNDNLVWKPSPIALVPAVRLAFTF